MSKRLRAQTSTLSIRIPSNMLDNLRRIARQRAFAQDKDITYVDLIREALVKEFPVQPEEASSQ